MKREVSNILLLCGLYNSIGTVGIGVVEKCLVVFRCGVGSETEWKCNCKLISLRKWNASVEYS